MIVPKNNEEAEELIRHSKTILFFTADWCGDCRYIKPVMPAIEAQFPAWQFVEVDRDKFIDLAGKWQIMGIPSFVACVAGKEVARFVNKDRKTKEEVVSFIQSIGN